MTAPVQVVVCPECGGSKVYKDGLRRTVDGETQRFLCRGCGFRFSIPNSLNAKDSNNRRSQQNNSSRGLVLVTQTESETVCAGKRMIQNGNFAKFLSVLENNGIQTNSANVYIGYLNAIVKAGANLLDTESVKATIAKKTTWNNKTKTLAAASYSKYLDVMGGSWKVPKFKAETPLPYIATESEINSLIDAATKKLSTYLLLLKETGMRSAEAWGLKWSDVDFERGGLTLNDTKKHGTPRGFKVSPRLTAMLNALPRHSKTWMFQNQTESASLIHFAAGFRFFRNTLSVKLQKPNLLKISFHSFRHWFATMEYNKTKNLLHVQERLGHKNILNTVIYTHLVNFEADAYNTSIALDVDEARKLVEAGFEFVTGEYGDGGKIFRKLK